LSRMFTCQRCLFCIVTIATLNSKVWISIEHGGGKERGRQEMEGEEKREERTETGKERSKMRGYFKFTLKLTVQ